MSKIIRIEKCGPLCHRYNKGGCQDFMDYSIRCAKDIDYCFIPNLEQFLEYSTIHAKNYCVRGIPLTSSIIEYYSLWNTWDNVVIGGI
jgi:hypothetical protein